MTHVLTLVADPDKGSLRPNMVEALRTALESHGAVVSPPDWLAPGAAADVGIAGLAPAEIRRTARDTVGGHPIDLAVQASAGRRKRLLVADMDSTIVTSETLDELAARAGLGDQVSEITARAMAGDLDFAGALRARVAMLAGLAVRHLDETRAGMVLTPGAKALVRTMKRQGAYTALVSGGFTDFADGIRDRCGFDEARANRLSITDAALDGGVLEPILDRHGKLAALHALCAARRIDPSQACTVGDGVNDLDMLTAAGLGVAFHGKPKVRAAAPHAVNHCGLVALLYFQGYREHEILA